VRPVEDLSNFTDQSADLIYASHVLEYFDLDQAPRVLMEWRRVLKKDGTLRLSVPDFDALVAIRSSASMRAIIGPLFGKIDGPDGSQQYHRVVYDRLLLAEVLRVSGFVRVRDWNWRTTEHADVDDFSQAYYPHMSKDYGRMVSLNMEADRQ